MMVLLVMTSCLFAWPFYRKRAIFILIINTRLLFALADGSALRVQRMGFYTGELLGPRF